MEGDIGTLAISPDEKFLAFSYSNSLYVMDLSSLALKKVDELKIPPSRDSSYRRTAWSKTGNSLLWSKRYEGVYSVSAVDKTGEFVFSNSREVKLINPNQNPAVSDSGFLALTGAWYPQIRCIVQPFTDIPANHQFCVEIDWLKSVGITTGYSDGTYKPDNYIERGAMAAFLYRIANSGATAPKCTLAPFTDVPTTHPFCGEIKWMADKRITTGYGDGTFRPAANVSRGAMAAFMYRIKNPGATASACTSAPFSDVQTTHQFCKEIQWLVNRGVTTGWPDGTFRPEDSVQRGAMAAFMYRISVW